MISFLYFGNNVNSVTTLGKLPMELHVCLNDLPPNWNFLGERSYNTAMVVSFKQPIQHYEFLHHVIIISNYPSRRTKQDIKKL